MTTIGNGKRSYYLVIAKGVSNWDVKIVDNNKGYEVLVEIKADSYDEATKMVSFVKNINGTEKFL